MSSTDKEVRVFTAPGGTVYAMECETSLGRLGVADLGNEKYRVRLEANSSEAAALALINEPNLAKWSQPKLDNYRYSLEVQGTNKASNGKWPSEVKMALLLAKRALGVSIQDAPPVEAQAKDLARALTALRRRDMSKSHPEAPSWRSKFVMDQLIYLRAAKQHVHHGQKPVQIGPYIVRPGAGLDLIWEDLETVDVLVNLAGERGIPGDYLKDFESIDYELVDFGGIPADWEEFLKVQILPVLKVGKLIMPFCEGGHGRTGTFLASLIAIVEADVEDPIAAIRERYCDRAVETLEQAEAIFALTGKPVPAKYMFGPERLIR